MDLSAVYDVRAIAKALSGRYSLAEQREAVLSLVALLNHRNKHHTATAPRDLAVRHNVANLWKSVKSAARDAAVAPAHDAPLLERQQYDEAMTERAARCTPTFVLQLIAVATGRNAHLDVSIARALSRYVLPLAASVLTDANEWVAVLTFIASGFNPKVSVHALLLLEGYLTQSATAAFENEACSKAWGRVFGRFTEVLLASRRSNQLIVARVVRAVPADKVASVVATCGLSADAALTFTATAVAVGLLPQIPNATLVDALNTREGLTSTVFTSAVPAKSTVQATSISEVVDLAIAKFATTITGVLAVKDLCTVLAMVPADAREGFLAENDRVVKLLEPVTRAPNAFTPAAAVVIGAAYGAVWPATVTAVSKIFTAAASMIVAKCNSAAERVALLTIVRGVTAAVLKEAPTAIPAIADMTPLLRTTVASAVPEVMAAAWALVSLVSSKELIAAMDTVKPLFKQAGNSEPTRRALFLGLPTDSAEIGPVASSFVADAESYRADAILALRFPSAVVAAKVDPARAASACFTLDGLSELANDERAIAAAAATATRLASQDGIMLGVAVMLGHRSGQARRAASASLAALHADASCGVALNLWRAVVHGIFGVASSPADIPKVQPSTEPAATGGAAANALSAAANSILRHYQRIPITEVFAELFLCLGHPIITGEDPVLVLQSRSALDGLYAGRGLNTRRVRALVYAIFKSKKAVSTVVDSLEFAAVSVAESLISFVTNSTLSPTVVVSAINGLAIMLTLVEPSIQELVYTALRKATVAASERILKLDPLTRAIVSIRGAAIPDFVHAELNAKGLIKTHGAKPPKGVSEDDFEAQIKKDNIALEAGRKKVLEAVEDAKKKLGTSALLFAAPYVALRVCGVTAGSIRNASAAEVAGAICRDLAVWVGVDKDGKPNAPHMLVQFAVEAAAALLRQMTTMGSLAEQFVRVAARLQQKPITAQDVLEANCLALRLRVAGVATLPSALFPVLLQLVGGAFTVVKGRTAKAVGAQAQHQLMTLLVANCALPDVADRLKGFELLIHLLDNFGGVFKLAMTACASLAAHSDPSEIKPLVHAMLCSGDSTREAAAGALARCSFLKSHRQTLLALAIARADPRAAVANIAKAAITQADDTFALVESDMALVTQLLEAHHRVPHAVTVITKAIATLIQQFGAAVEETALTSIRKLPLAVASVQAFHSLHSIVSAEGRVNILHAIADIAEVPETPEDVMRSVLTCGRDILSKADDRDLTKTFIPGIQPRLRGIAAKNAGAKGDHKEQLNALTTAWLTVMATRSDDAKYLNDVLDSLVQILSAAQSPAVHYTLAECVSDLARHPALRDSPKLVEFGELCIKQTLNSAAYIKKKAHANAFAGIIVGAGLIALRKFRTLAVIEEASRDKQSQRSGAMIMLETLTEHLGVLFEPYMLVMTQTMLDSIAEKDTKIAECADDAAKAMMTNLSDIGLRQLVPKLVEGLQSDQNKKKSSSLGLISYIAYCSPKQLASTLPTVIPHITECLFDANSGVSNAAFNALKRVAGTVANPEVQEHIDVILDAMRHPASDTEAALDALLYTRFTTAIDPASLALVIPVVARGLAERDSNVRGKAAQIVASLVGLVSEPAKTLLPYASELLTKLQTTSQDPLPGVRATSAKATSVLVATISKRHVDEAIEWCTSIMARPTTSSAEKCGAAQVLMDICGTVGAGLLSTLLDTINAGCTNEVASVRESYMYIFVYAPSSLPSDIVTEFLPTLFPFVLQGLADSAEKVRAVALQAGTNIINGYGSKHLNLVLEPLLRGVVDENPSARQSSLLLASKLLIHMVTELRRKHRLEEAAGGSSDEDEDKEDGMGASESSDGVTRMASARDAEKSGMSILGYLEETLGTENFIRLMAAVHIARSEPNAVVRAEVTTAWQICVASPRTALIKIAPGIVEILVKFASSDRGECNELAEKCVEYTCQRIHEMIDTFVIAFARIYNNGGRRHKIGALACMSETVPFAEAPRLERLAPHIIQVVLPSLSKQDDESKEERTLAAALVERVSKIMGKHWIDDMVQRQLDTQSVVGVIEIVRVKPRQSLPAVFKTLTSRLQDKPLQYDIDLLSELCDLDDVRADVTQFYDQVTHVLCNGAVHGLENVEEAFTRFANFIVSTEYFGTTVFPEFSRRLKTPHTRQAALRCVASFFEGVPAKASDAIIDSLRLVLGAFGDSDGNVRDAAARAFISMAAALDRKSAEGLGEEQDATALRRAAGRFSVQFVEVIQSSLLATIHATVSGAPGEERELIILRYPKLNDCILNYYNRALDYGTAVNKLQAIDGIEEVVRHVSATIRPVLLNTVMAKCVKTLYERNDGSVVSAVLNLLLHAMDYDKSGKNKVLERTIASSVFGATLSDSPEARTLGLRVASELLKRDTLYAEPMLSMMLTKKGSIDSSTTRAATCRFISVVMRHGRVERQVKNMAQLHGIVRPFWDAPESVGVAAAAGTAMASLAVSSTQTDEEVGTLIDEALSKAAGKGAGVVAGLACLYTLTRYVHSRVEVDLHDRAGAVLRNILLACANDRLIALWALRLAAVLASINPATIGKIDSAHAILKRVELNDDLMMSTSAYAINLLSKAFPAAHGPLHECRYGDSTICVQLGDFDPDFEDESCSASITY